VKPNIISFSAAISACEKGQQCRQALRLLRVMPQQGVTPNVVSYNAAISACEKGQQWQLALDLLQEMPSKAVAPDSITYNAAIAACATGQQWQLAVQILREMPGKGVSATTTGYGSAIAACKQAGQLELAAELAKEVPERVVSPEAARVLAKPREKIGAAQVAPQPHDMEKSSVQDVSYLNQERFSALAKTSAVQTPKATLAPRKSLSKPYMDKTGVQPTFRKAKGAKSVAKFGQAELFGWVGIFVLALVAATGGELISTVGVEDWLYWATLVVVGWAGWSGKFPFAARVPRAIVKATV